MDPFFCFALTDEQELLMRHLESARFALDDVARNQEAARKQIANWCSQDGDQGHQDLAELQDYLKRLETILDDLHHTLQRHFAAENAQRRALQTVGVAS